MAQKKEKELTLTQKITSVLKESAGINSEGYIGSEWTEAADRLSKLDPPVVLGIPWCVWDYVLDEFGEPVLEVEYDSWGRSKKPEITEQDSEEEKEKKRNWKPKPKRVDRKDVLAILLLAPMQREDPGITVEQIGTMLNHETIRESTRMVFKFWGVDLAPIEENLAKLADALEEGEAVEDVEETHEAEEVEKTENFTA